MTSGRKSACFGRSDTHVPHFDYRRQFQALPSVAYGHLGSTVGHRVDRSRSPFLSPLQALRLSRPADPPGPAEEAVRREHSTSLSPWGPQAVATGAGGVVPSWPRRLGGEFGMLVSTSRLTLALAEAARGARAPRTASMRSPTTCPIATIDCPCVVKPACEVEMKGVFYVRDDAERTHRVGQLLPVAVGTRGPGAGVHFRVRGGLFRPV